MSELRPYPKPSYPQRAKTALHYLLPQLAVTRAAGWLAERRWGVLTTLAVKAFAARYKVDMSEAEKSRAGDYASFNEFFIRPLKADARPIDANPAALCLPADGCVSEAGAIEAGRLIQAKGHSFSALELLAGDAALAAEFSDGLFLTTYLSPRDYHRVHMPCAATLRRMIYVPGELYSVNPFLAQHIPNLFARNERLICVFDTGFGSMVQILVGATVTASISTVWAGVVNPPRPQTVLQWLYPADGADAVKLEKGQEMGAFRLGSTVINLFPQGSVRLNDTLRPGAPVRMGALLGERAEAV
ncbi:Phosphatidylserine decarboxylase proenzyme [Kingella potus]|uniref:Phosphatidylserine decarboxylase proenzyme n=1 Tax=Kingella potus TaxID=265175 RepID=A0A377R151_9NEIS|nr:archaetidylserine decarboxylase [Kingella potus]UOP00879.1 archaetidylserine decarboxylase [Kingella potus]STR00528.1 Phosphatidylserine decarboxylase proenzyme [Kingella potus]